MQQRNRIIRIVSKKPMTWTTIILNAPLRPGLQFDVLRKHLKSMTVSSSYYQWRSIEFRRTMTFFFTKSADNDVLLNSKVRLLEEATFRPTVYWAVGIIWEYFWVMIVNVMASEASEKKFVAKCQQYGASSVCRMDARGRRPCSFRQISGRTASMTVHSHFKHWF